MSSQNIEKKIANEKKIEIEKKIQNEKSNSQINKSAFEYMLYKISTFDLIEDNNVFYSTGNFLARGFDEKKSLHLEMLEETNLNEDHNFFSTFIKTEENLIETLRRLAKRNAYRDFNVILDHTIQSKLYHKLNLNIFDIIKKQYIDFFDDCGQYLLFYFLESLISKRKSLKLEKEPIISMINFLLERNISPNFKINHKYFSPLVCLIKSDISLLEKNKLLEYFCKMGVSLNESQTDKINYSHPLSFPLLSPYSRASSEVSTLLIELGANPLLLKNTEYKLILDLLDDLKDNPSFKKIKLLLSFGTGLISQNDRIPEDFDLIIDGSIDADILKNSEIVFKNFGDKDKHWIFTLKELEDLLSRIDQLTINDQKHIQQIARFVVESKGENLQNGVFEIFEKFTNRQKSKMLTLYNNIKQDTPLHHNETKLILNYLNSDNKLIEEITMYSNGR